MWDVVHCCVCCVLGCVLGCVCVCWCWCWWLCGAWCAWCVCGVWHAENPVCRFKTLPCVGSKRAHVLNMRAFCRYTGMRFEPTHGEEGRGEGWWWWWWVAGGGGRGGFYSLSLFPSLFLSSVVLFLFSLSLLSSRSCRLSLAPLSATMTTITRSVGSLWSA